MTSELYHDDGSPYERLLSVEVAGGWTATVREKDFDPRTMIPWQPREKGAVCAMLRSNEGVFRRIQFDMFDPRTMKLLVSVNGGEGDFCVVDLAGTNSSRIVSLRNPPADFRLVVENPVL